jgi:DTW domain-containing protein YfiP
MCGYISSISTNTKFIILMHPKEFKKVKNNTGFFTHLSLENSEVFIGIDFSEHRKINEIIATHESYILFPSEGALNLTTTKPQLSSKPLAIFLIDSTWACAKKMFLSSSNLQKLKHMSFTTTKTSQYQIKEQPNEAYLSTIESTLVVLELLDKHKIEIFQEEELKGFLTPFLKMIEYQKNIIANPLSHAVRFKRHHTK